MFIWNAIVEWNGIITQLYDMNKISDESECLNFDRIVGIFIHVEIVSLYAPWLWYVYVLTKVGEYTEFSPIYSPL